MSTFGPKRSQSFSTHSRCVHTARKIRAGLVAAVFTLTSPMTIASDETSNAALIADALSAAPPSVTQDAKIYSWNAKGQLYMLRHGTGPYHCLTSGFSSTRLGKPRLAYPDPMCLDQNAWTYMQAVWSEKNPMQPRTAYPTAPGLVWMLAGMPVKSGKVAIGEKDNASVEALPSTTDQSTFQMSPHIMIMPLPTDEKIAKLPAQYQLNRPLSTWVMAAGTPLEHLMVHLSKDNVRGLMEPTR